MGQALNWSKLSKASINYKQVVAGSITLWSEVIIIISNYEIRIRDTFIFIITLLGFVTSSWVNSGRARVYSPQKSRLKKSLVLSAKLN